jgi:hypothetical protein
MVICSSDKTTAQAVMLAGFAFPLSEPVKAASVAKHFVDHAAASLLQGKLHPLSDSRQKHREAVPAKLTSSLQSRMLLPFLSP